MDRLQESVAFTVVTRNYFHYAVALYESLVETMPGFTFVVYLVDRFPESFEHSPAIDALIARNSSNFKVVPAEQLGIERWTEFAFKYTPFELSCALKPFAARHAIDNFADKIIYCDSDLEFHSSLDAIVEKLDNASILLTPHLSRHNAANVSPNDVDSDAYLGLAPSGVYNAGFFALANSSDTDGFLDWWCARCNSNCVVDQAGGVFVDQSWLNFVPALFSNVHIERSPAYNVAYWNLADRQLRFERDAGWVVGDRAQRMCFFHFSGFQLEQPEKVTKHHRISRFDDRDFHGLCQGYAARVGRFAPSHYSDLACRYERLSDGMHISPLWRESVRNGLVAMRDCACLPWESIDGELVERLRASEPQAVAARLPWHVAELDRITRTMQAQMSELERQNSDTRFISKLSRWADVWGHRSAG